MRRFHSILVLSILSLALPARAEDWYVDALLGSNANSGSAPNQAWQTLTHALANTPAPAPGLTQVVHLAPGTYDAALGETFPIVLRNAFQIVGDQGSAVTLLDGGGAGAVLRASHSHFNPNNYIGPLTLVRGVALENAVLGVDLFSGTLPIYLTLEDVRITGMFSEGVSALSSCGWGCGSIVLALTRVEMSFCGLGLHLRNSSNSAASSAALVDCIVRDNQTHGIFQENSSSILSCSRTRIHGNGSHGLWVEPAASLGPTYTTLQDCLVAQNAGCGVRAEYPTSGNPGLHLDLLRCTIADNGASGVDAYYDWLGNSQTTLQGSILYGNQDDVHENPAAASIVLAQYCDIGDGDFAGGLGNLAADPNFREPLALDYRPAWSSPCVDVGDPATPAGRDLAGAPRSLDGDLDALARADIGALESATLVATGPAHSGSNLVFEQWGPLGGRGVLLLSRGAPASVPLPTGFGDFYLVPNAFRNLGPARVAPGPPVLRVFGVPADPGWIGKTFTFQMLETSSVAAPAAAWSNPVRIVVLP